MYQLSGARALGHCVAPVVLALSATIGLAAPASADEHIDPAIVDIVIESRYQKPANQATPEERATALDELENIFAVTDLPRAKTLANESRLKAQLDLQRRALIFQAFVADFMEKNPATDEEINEVYQEQVVQAPQTEYKARHILVETQSDALEVIEELQGGAEFEELAKTKSTGPSGPSGGDLGWFSAQSMVKPFSDAVAAMENGTFTSEPVQTQFGWHVIFREDSRDSSPPPLDSVRDVIKQRVEQEKFQDYMNSLNPTGDS